MNVYHTQKDLFYTKHPQTIARNHNNDTRVIGQGLYKGLKCDFLIPRNENL